MRTRTSIIVHKNDRDKANAALEKHYGPNTFSVGLIPASQNPAEPPATHYTCSWAMSYGEKRHVQKLLSDAGITVTWRESSFSEAMAAEGLKRVPDRVV